MTLAVAAGIALFAGQPATASTSCTVSKIDINGTAAGHPPFAGSATLDCPAATAFTTRFRVDGRIVQEGSSSGGPGTVQLSAQLPESAVPGLVARQKVCFEAYVAGSRAASTCQTIPVTDKASSSDCIGLHADLERFFNAGPNDPLYGGDAWLNCPIANEDLYTWFTVNGSTVQQTFNKDWPWSGETDVFDFLDSSRVPNLQPGQEVCYGAGYDPTPAAALATACVTID
jgi:hypothetical protein